MPNHNRAMVNAANSMMEEYGDAMQNAMFNTASAPKKHQLALPNPLDNGERTKLMVVAVAGALLFAAYHKQKFFPRA